MVASGEFLYFSFGSNLCADRLHIQNPSSKLVGIAKLKGYKLAFSLVSSRWHGGAADVIADEEAEVWGGVWSISDEDSESLDAQEGVHVDDDGVDVGAYRRIEVEVNLPSPTHGTFMKPEDSPCLEYVHFGFR